LDAKKQHEMFDFKQSKHWLHPLHVCSFGGTGAQWKCAYQKEMTICYPAQLTQSLSLMALFYPWKVLHGAVCFLTLIATQLESNCSP